MGRGEGEERGEEEGENGEGGIRSLVDRESSSH